MPNETILLPLDGSIHAQYACEVALKFAKLVPGKEIVHMLYCMEPIPELIGGKEREKLKKDYDEEAEKIFAPCLEKFKAAGSPCHTHVAYGEVGETIAKMAEQLGCDYIIMGTRGRSDISSAVLGSVSHHVLQLSKVPVLLAKMPK